MGIGLPHAGRRAAASLAALRQLAAMRDMLAARAAQRAAAGPSPTLGMHLAALAERGGRRGLGLAALALAPEEAATLARAFARHDADGDDKLTAPELKALMADLVPGAAKQPVSDEAARAALEILDADGDGLVELDEFSAWYATSRLWHQGEAALQGGAEGGAAAKTKQGGAEAPLKKEE